VSQPEPQSPIPPAQGDHALRKAAAILALALAMGGAGLSATLAQPMQLPGSVGSSPAGTPVTPPAAGGPVERPPAGFPTPARPAAPSAKPVADDAVVGQALMHEGRAGRFVMERVGRSYGLRFNAEGFQTGNLLEPCGVSFGEQPVPLEPMGRPDGLARFRLQSSACPIVFDVLDNALLVIEPQAPCVIEAAQCRINPRGLWAPDARGLTALAKEIERDRGRAETQVREGFRLLGARANADEQRAIAREQAGFSSEREQICREFAREPNHGFCAAKVTEARAASLRARILATEPKPRR
jgi:hypothetical protein